MNIRIPDEHPLNAHEYGKAFAATARADYAIEGAAAPEDFARFVHDLQASGVAVFLRVPVKSPSWHEQKSVDDSQPKVFLMNAYRTGGTRGYGPEGERQKRYSSDRPRPPFDHWETTLMTFWPDITNSERKELEKVVLSELSWNVNEYYGDSTDHTAQHIDAEKLFLILKHENRLTPLPQSHQPHHRFAQALEQALPVVEYVPAPPKPPR